MSNPWCPVCCTRHDLGPICPGDLQPTDTERVGWRVQVSAGTRTEQYGVLIAPAGDLWRARVVTFPRMLWSVPGGRGTMKFVARSPSAVEDLARRFVLEVCRARGYRVVTTPRRVMPPSLAAPAGSSDDAQQDPRIVTSMPVRFGVVTADRAGATADLSNNGLFVITERPLPRGTRVVLVLELELAQVPLTGIVAWLRPRAEQGKPAGMGLQLSKPPAIYRHLVSQLGSAAPTPYTEGEEQPEE